MAALPYSSAIRITRVHPPVPAGYDRRTIAQAPAHDPVRARRVVSELSTVAGVVEECEPMRRLDVGSPRTVADLDRVTVGCWGGAVQITDPAFGEDGITTRNLDSAFDAQVTDHPDARVIGVCEMDFSMSYVKYLLHVPGVPPVRADGWDGTDGGMDLTGDPVRVLHAIGVPPGDPGNSPVSLDDLERFLWSDYVDVASCGLNQPFADESLMVSVFRVRRSEDIRDAMDEVWHRA
ncbi:hypothetical protein ADL22_16825 [Streptomyces sp. NRRL F-4489]|uniref:DUF6333 family protein n=1 Tax=Streptomyces sp. NRRL F-4489 TaxID=1609095 RepID=UPI0007463F15|nr:DUF6333 family protein [Streptomyces sp. NRRL F-4489]KUL38910.1 hypothetical protein ADL22_16825 [Streptomyces sp. NRRL F-4489]